MLIKGMPPVARLIAHDVLDRLLGISSTDWVAHEREQLRKTEAQLATSREKQSAARVQGTSPTHALPAYAGMYEHPGYGRITVSEHSGQLQLTLDRVTVALEHFHYDVFKTVRPPGGSWQFGIGASRRVGFGYGHDGQIDRLEVDSSPPSPISCSSALPPDSLAGLTSDRAVRHPRLSLLTIAHISLKMT